MSERRRKSVLIPLILLCLCLLLPAMLHLANGTDLFGPTYYNTYTRQAMAWREGLLHLPEDVPALELAVYENEYYVSFPPVPSLVELPLTFLFGFDTPDNLLMVLYMTFSCLCLYFAFRKKGQDCFSAGGYAFFLCYASCILPLCMNGAVWYHAQLLGFALIAGCILLFSFDKPTGGLICFALSVGCRPFNVLYGVLIGMGTLVQQYRAHKTPRQVVKKLLPGVLAGLVIACAYGVYNLLRFGDPFEFGHNYLPEFSFQGGVQFSLSHVPNNLKNFVLRMPFYSLDGGKTLNLQQFGFCMLIANPVLPLMLVWFFQDLFQGKKPVKGGCILLTCLLHLFLLLLHRTFGGFQFGARYTCDLILYGALYLQTEKRRLTGAETVIFLFSLAFSVYGALTLHL